MEVDSVQYVSHGTRLVARVDPALAAELKAASVIDQADLTAPADPVDLTAPADQAAPADPADPTPTQDGGTGAPGQA